MLLNDIYIYESVKPTLQLISKFLGIINYIVTLDLLVFT